MASYLYPQVPRTVHHAPSVQTINTTTATATDPGSSRFSWVATPADASARSWRRKSQVPPVPVVPDHVNASIRHNGEYQQQLDRALYNHTQQQQLQQQRQQQQELQHPHHDQVHFPPHSPSSPAPASIPEPEPKAQSKGERDAPRIDIGPDENPLRASSPSLRQRSSPSTANMQVLSPTSLHSGSGSGNANAKAHGGGMPPFRPQPPAPDPHRHHASRGGSFSHGLCSCSQPAVCATSVFCPCITYGKTQYRLGLRSAKKDPTDLLGYRTVNASCFAFGLLCGINGILAAIQHTRVRKTYGMGADAGNVFDDCVKGCCCCCCLVAQDEKEVRQREEGHHHHSHHAKGSTTTTTTSQGYVHVQNMVFNRQSKN